MNINIIFDLEGGWLTKEVTKYQVVLNADIKQNTTALHHNKATQGPTDCQKHEC
jgi:hypothetical protein